MLTRWYGGGNKTNEDEHPERDEQLLHDLALRLEQCHFELDAELALRDVHVEVP